MLPLLDSQRQLAMATPVAGDVILHDCMLVGQDVAFRTDKPCRHQVGTVVRRRAPAKRPSISRFTQGSIRGSWPDVPAAFACQDTSWGNHPKSSRWV
jgi:hypothetical protein